MLHGAETFVYERAPGGGGDGPRLTPRAGVRVSHLSPTAVARVLDKFAQAGGALLEIAAFVTWALAARSGVPEAYRAFAAQVAAFCKSLRERKEVLALNALLPRHPNDFHNIAVALLVVRMDFASAIVELEACGRGKAMD